MTPLLTHTPYLKRILFPVALMPALFVLFIDLGANPVERLLHYSGDWALRFLVIALAVTPVGRLAGWTAFLGTRRMLGLFAFVYALLHAGIYLILDQGLSWWSIVTDIGERPFITLGFVVFVILSALAATSTRRMAKRLGRRWKSLHRLVYPAALGAVLHFLWLVKADNREPLVYFAIVVFLLLLRLPVFVQRMGRPRGSDVPRTYI